MNKYLEKIAAVFKVDMGKGEKATLSDKEHKKYKENLDKGPGFGRKLLRGVAGGVFGGVGAVAATKGTGASPRVRAVADTVGTAVGAVAGWRSGAAKSRADAVRKLSEKKNSD